MGGYYFKHFYCLLSRIYISYHGITTSNYFSYLFLLPLPAITMAVLQRRLKSFRRASKHYISRLNPLLQYLQTNTSEETLINPALPPKRQRFKFYEHHDINSPNFFGGGADVLSSKLALDPAPKPPRLLVTEYISLVFCRQARRRR